MSDLSIITSNNLANQGIKRAIANVAALQTDSVVIPAKAGFKLRILAFHTQTGAIGTNITFNSKPAGAGTAISPLLSNASNGGGISQWNPAGWFETNNGEGLSVTTSAGSTTGVNVTYAEIRDLT